MSGFFLTLFFWCFLVGVGFDGGGLGGERWVGVLLIGWDRQQAYKLCKS